MFYEMNVAYELRCTRVAYGANTSLSLSPKMSVHNFDKDISNSYVFSKTPVFEDIVRETTFYNNIYSFYYFTKENKVDLLDKRFNYVNNDRITIAGINFQPYSGLILELCVNRVRIEIAGENGKPNKEDEAYKVEVVLEKEVEKPLYKIPIPIRGFYFRNPKTDKPSRIQFSSNPEHFTNNTSKYPDSVEVYNGLGFYSEDRPDLNVQDPVYLTKDGGILYGKDTPDYTYVYDKNATGWGGLGFPEKVGLGGA